MTHCDQLNIATSGPEYCCWWADNSAAGTPATDPAISYDNVETRDRCSVECYCNEMAVANSYSQAMLTIDECPSEVCATCRFKYIVVHNWFLSNDNSSNCEFCCDEPDEIFCTLLNDNETLPAVVEKFEELTAEMCYDCICGNADPVTNLCDEVRTNSGTTLRNVIPKLSIIFGLVAVVFFH
jgi:hypothetical protein